MYGGRGRSFLMLFQPLNFWYMCDESKIIFIYKKIFLINEKYWGKNLIWKWNQSVGDDDF
jgi:hypothetical protein